MHVLPDLTLILIHSFDHCKLVQDIIDVEQGCSRCSEGIEKPIVGFPKVVSKCFIALIDVTRLQRFRLERFIKKPSSFPWVVGAGVSEAFAILKAYYSRNLSRKCVLICELPPEK